MSRLTLAALFLSLPLHLPAAGAEVRLDGRTFTVPDGFTVERVAGPPVVDRPIVADFDELGRLYVADSSGSNDKVEKQLADKPHRIVRLEDADGDGAFEKQTVFADRMMFPEGTMWLDGSLYVSAPPSIWKLTDTDNDGKADKREEWFQGKTLTGCANDLHGPYAGPDGWVYWCKGAFAEQRYTLPSGKPFVTRASHIFRCRPDGSGVEPVMTGGMDNPVDVVFTPGGERIFSTTFFQHPGGGQRDGLIHAVYGGVYGKVHDVIDNHVRTGPDVMPVMTHLGPAAPCGLARYESQAFGPEYKDNLFCALFNMHKVTRHVLVPDGATFKTKDEDFLVCDSLDFHPTDVVEDADGSLLVIDTGGWYKLCCPTSQLHKPDVLGAIYRVRRTDASRPDDPRGNQFDWAKMSDGTLTVLLYDDRPAVRRRAVAALVACGPAAVEPLRQTIQSSTEQWGRLNAVWAAARIDHPGARAAVRAALDDRDETVRQAAAHCVALWRDREAIEPLSRLIERDSPHNRRAAAEALGRIGDAAVMGPIEKAARGPLDGVLEHSVTYAMIETGDAKGLGNLLQAEPRVRRMAMIALDQIGGGQLKPETVVEALSSPDAPTRDAAAWIAGRHPEWGDAVAGALLRQAGAASLSQERRDRLARQLAGIAKAPAVQSLLAKCVSDVSSPPGERRCALAAMAASGLKEAPRPWLDALAQVLEGKDASLAADALSVLRRVPAPKDAVGAVAQRLLRLAEREDLPARVRLEALAAAPAGQPLSSKLFDFVTTELGPDQPAAQRTVAADAASRAKFTPQQLTSLAAAVRNAGALEVGRLLPAFEQSQDEKVGLALVAALNEAKSSRALRGDMVRPRLAKYPPAVQKAAEPLLAKLDPGAAEQRQRLDELLSSLPSGDVRRGQAVFHSNKTACATCHAIGYLGGTVGPDLTRIGAVRAERDLLESIAFPSASFVQTYEPVLLDTTAGDRHSGILRRNDGDEVHLITGPTQEVRLPRNEVKEIRPGTVSVMPSGLEQQLSNQELADLLAFLKACR